MFPMVTTLSIYPGSGYGIANFSQSIVARKELIFSSLMVEVIEEHQM